MEKIFDIAKDKEQSWGTLATAIDGNFEEVDAEVNVLRDLHTTEFPVPGFCMFIKEMYCSTQAILNTNKIITQNKTPCRSIFATIILLLQDLLSEKVQCLNLLYS